MTTEQNKNLVRRFYKAFEANDGSALTDVLAPDLVAYSHGSPTPQNREEHVKGIQMWNEAFRDTRFTIEEQIAEGDMVATRVTMRSTHSGGEFQGVPPTGKQVETAGISIEQIQDGKIVARRVYSDWVGLMQQLGIAPSPTPTR
jgi:steroid delta-isomerase-like uncharacterized protein